MLTREMMEFVGGAHYIQTKDLARFWQVSTRTVARRLEDIESIHGRYRIDDVANWQVQKGG